MASSAPNAAAAGAQVIYLSGDSGVYRLERTLPARLRARGWKVRMIDSWQTFRTFTAWDDAVAYVSSLRGPGGKAFLIGYSFGADASLRLLQDQSWAGAALLSPGARGSLRPTWATRLMHEPRGPLSYSVADELALLPATLPLFILQGDREPARSYLENFAGGPSRRLMRIRNTGHFTLSIRYETAARLHDWMLWCLANSPS